VLPSYLDRLFVTAASSFFLVLSKSDTYRSAPCWKFLIRRFGANPKISATRTLRTLRANTVSGTLGLVVVESAVVVISTPPRAAKPEISGIASNRVRERP